MKIFFILSLISLLTAACGSTAEQTQETPPTSIPATTVPTEIIEPSPTTEPTVTVEPTAVPVPSPLSPTEAAYSMLFKITNEPDNLRAPGGVAASNIPLEQGGYTPIGRVSGSDCKINLLGIIPVSGGNQISDAMRDAQGNADALVNISVDLVSKFWILWSSTCTEVRATAVSLD